MFVAGNMESSGLAAVGSLTIVYSLDYVRAHLASDAGSGKKTFCGLFDYLSFYVVPKYVNAVVETSRTKRTTQSWKEDLLWIVRLFVLLCSTEVCQRRGGDEQDKAHHSVCRLVDPGVRSSVSFACGGLWPLILAPVEMPTCESARIWNRASTGKYR